MQVEFKNKTMLEKVIIVVIVIVGLICLYGISSECQNKGAKGVWAERTRQHPDK